MRLGPILASLVLAVAFQAGFEVGVRSGVVDAEVLAPRAAQAPCPVVCTPADPRQACLTTCEEADEYVRRCGCACRTHLYIREGGAE
jgi:hypothetical protein